MTLMKMPRFPKMKKWHDKKLIRKEFKERDRVLIFNSKLRLFPSKLKSRWTGPLMVILVSLSGAIGLRFNNGQEFKVNGQRLKHYIREELAFKESIQLKE